MSLKTVKEAIINIGMKGQEMNQTLIMVAGIVLLLVVLGIIFFM